MPIAGVGDAAAEAGPVGVGLMGTVCRIRGSTRFAEIPQRRRALLKGQDRCALVRDGVIAVRKNTNNI